MTFMSFSLLSHVKRWRDFYTVPGTIPQWRPFIIQFHLPLSSQFNENLITVPWIFNFISVNGLSEKWVKERGPTYITHRITIRVWGVLINFLAPMHCANVHANYTWVS
ncbi:hypothetical protein KM043_012277 [Ampulex compressa]|nr:hypothetical protein KM043_012277 [Ampulex compressa]